MYLLESASLGENPYWVFVSFLYAWVAADIAERFSKLSSNWSQYKNNFAHVPIWSHLMLAAFVVATSWFGWSLSFVNGDVAAFDIKDVRGVIVPLSLLLIVDFWILGTYFAFVLVVNEARKSGKHGGTWSPSSGSAAYWVLWILLAYVVWDFLVYFLLPLWTNPSRERFWASSWMSVLCLGLALGAFLWLNRIQPSRPFCILFGDASLVALFLYLRALKQLASGAQPHWLRGFSWGCLLAFLLMGFLAGLLGKGSKSTAPSQGQSSQPTVPAGTEQVAPVGVDR